MNMLIWNCRDALNPTFYDVVNDLIRMHSLVIMIFVETKVSGERARRISKNLDLDGAIFSNSIGLTGGLWVLWNFAQVKISELASTEEEVHVVVTSTAKPPWLLSTIYASPQFAERHLFWENLEYVASFHSVPWVIAGDFNEVLMGDDKFGGSSINIDRALRFQECMDICRMINIGFSGPRFTWSNRRPYT